MDLINRFIGRESEIFEIKRYLSDTRLVTITGVGGSGKTRLASQVFFELQRKNRKTVYRIDLTHTTDLCSLQQSIAVALGIPREAGEVDTNLLVNYLHRRKVIFVLDNCEHRAEECAQLVSTLLASCPHVRFLVTSRETLDIPGEQVWQIPPLRLPDLTCIPPLDECLRYETIQLFIGRVMAVRPSFKLTQENIETIAQICWRLDCLPLAIELVASQTKVLSLKQIRARLDDDNWLLTISNSRIQSRHQTMRMMIDVSHNLLPEKERLLLYRLSVFQGRFTLEVVENVCFDKKINRGDILRLLINLVNKSLVIAEENEDEMCYRLLEMIRLYGREKLREIQEEKMIDERYQIWHRSTMSGFPNGLASETQPPLGALSTNVALRSASLPALKIEPTPSPVLRIFALGPMRVYWHEHVLTRGEWKYAKARELFCYLLIHPGKTKEQIGLSLWPDISPDQLRNNFHSVLHCLRKALGDSKWIRFENNLYFFNNQLHYWFDVEVFEGAIAQARKLLPELPEQAIPRLQEAIDLYHGDLFEDPFVADWYLPRRMELRNQYEQALLTLGGLYFAERRYTEAAQVYSQLISYNNFLEIAHRELIHCHERLGERGQALLHYQTFAQIMKDELDTTPSLETRKLIERLRRDEAV